MLAGGRMPLPPAGEPVAMLPGGVALPVGNPGRPGGGGATAGVAEPAGTGAAVSDDALRGLPTPLLSTETDARCGAFNSSRRPR